jgi:transcriptional regulator with XRE-family HTH domain
MNTIGQKIRLLRRERGWSQEDVAKRLNISIPAFSKIETGITDVNLSRIAQLAALFKLSVVDLLANDRSTATSAYHEDLNQLNEKLRRRENEVISLQKKVIELFETLKREQSAIMVNA